MPEAELEGLKRDQSDWTGYVDYDKGDAAGIAGEIATIRKQRYATSQGGLKPGVNSVAAPIWL